MFFWNSCFFDDAADVGNLTSGSPAFSKTLNIWKFTVHVLLKPGLENFERYFTSVWDECNCVVVWAFFSTAFLWDWNENWPFPVPWPLLSFPDSLTYWVQHFHSIVFTLLSPKQQFLSLISPGCQWTSLTLGSFNNAELISISTCPQWYRIQKSKKKTWYFCLYLREC